MHPSTEVTQAPPALARTTRSAPAAPQGGVPGRFGDALAQAMALPEPAATATPATPGAAAAPASPAPTDAMKGQPLANALPALPDAAAKLEPHPVAGPSKPAGDEPGTATEAEQDKPSAEAAKPSEEPQPPAPSQPILPTLPQAAPSQAAPIVAQPDAAPFEAGGAAPSTGEDGSATAVAGVDGRQPSSTSAPAAAVQTPAPSATTPPHVAASPGPNEPAAHAVQGRRSADTAEKEPTAAAPAIPVDATPFPAIALAPPSAAPASIGPHPAPSQASPRPSAAAGEPAPPSAAVQVGPVLASFAASAAQPGAPQHLTIRLDPLDLGRVQVHIERLPDGSARVDLKVEKPDTLLLLLRDQPQLHRALDLAGVPSAERTLQFHLAPPDLAPSNAASPGSMAAQSNADQGHGQQRPGQPQSGRFAAHGPASSLGEPIPGTAAFRRAGVDITA